MIKIFPSTNPSPEDQLLDYISVLQSAGAEFIHCDVMDGIFVGNHCLDVALLDDIASRTTIGMDVHLMMVEPMTNVQKYMHLPATYITTHYEAYNSVQNIIKMSNYIRNNKKLMGISIKPNTPIERIKKLLPLFDLVLIMSVEPGMSGQTFNESTYEKIKELRTIIDSQNLNIKIEVDGGINENNMQQVVDAGADILVMGNAMYLARDKSAIFKKSKMMYRRKSNI
ncbi:MAG: ribulose-phosphate 3-epimerase [Clostridiales bacterium]|nr:ribulose-phosphate 3-epimerase [Clostridiales bacterium]